jgi:hypothetical protein
VIAGPASPLVRELGVVVPEAPGSLAITPGQLTGREVLLACGRDEPALVQALTEISTAVAHAENPAATLRPAHARDPSGVFGAPTAPVTHGAAPNSGLPARSAK